MLKCYNQCKVLWQAVNSQWDILLSLDFVQWPLWKAVGSDSSIWSTVHVTKIELCKVEHRWVWNYSQLLNQKRKLMLTFVKEEEFSWSRSWLRARQNAKIDWLSPFCSYLYRRHSPWLALYIFGNFTAVKGFPFRSQQSN